MQTTNPDELAPADFLAELFRRRGIEVDIDHLDAAPWTVTWSTGRSKRLARSMLAVV